MQQTLRTLRPELSDTQLQKFQTYYEMLVDWNTRMNLTAITDPVEVATKHFHDSLAAAQLLPEHAKCIDVGTGAGFPGVPLLLVREDITVTLLDGLNKRLTFLDAVTKALGIEDRVQLVHARAEDGGKDPNHREQYDIAVTRAVANLPVLLELTVPFLKVGGKSICYKGDAAEEIAAAKSACHLLHCKVSTETVESDYGARSLVIAEKIAPTPKAYPRKAGTPSKKPL